MFTSGPQYTKLKTNLRLAVNRLKLLEKKKTEQAQKARKEIADFIAAHKEDRARIRVEHIIREDYVVEAYELLEMYCDLLLARFGLIQQMKFVYSMLDSDSALAICRDIDGGIEEAVNSILWAAPRLVTDVQEFKVISDNLTLKYGKPFAEACRANQFDKVNPKLMAKLGVAAPPKILVEKFSLAVYRFELCLQTRYMIEIAKSCNVPFTPDMNIMREDEVAQAEAMLIDFQQQGQPNSFGWMYPNPHTAPPPGDVPPPYTGNRGNGGGGGGGGQMIAAPQQPQAPPPVTRAFDYPNLKQQGAPSSSSASQPPPHDDMTKVPITGGFPSAPSAGYVMPNLPDVPNDFDDYDPDEDSQNDGAKPPDAIDFDDLNKRFENLKKRN